METDTRLLLSLLAATNLLKRVPRMGWRLRGVGAADTESVAEHTYGVAITALLLAEHIPVPLDRGRLLTVCLLHDLPEAATMDLVPTAIRYLTPARKRQAEEAALADLLAAVPSSEELRALWLEFQAGTSPESRLARDADKLEMLLQAAAYEKAGWQGLDEFWDSMTQRCWEFAISASVFHELAAERRARLRRLAPDR